MLDTASCSNRDLSPWFPIFFFDALDPVWKAALDPLRNKMSEFCLEMLEKSCVKSRLAMTPDDAIDPPISAEAEADEDDEPKTSEKPAGSEAGPGPPKPY